MALGGLELGQPREVAAALSMGILFAYLVNLTRFLAARTAEIMFDSIYRMASSPIEAAVLAVLALALASWSLDRHTKAAQLLSSVYLRLLSSVIVSAQQQQRQVPAVGPAHSVEDAKASVGAVSPSKEVASFRLPERSIQAGASNGSSMGTAKPRRRPATAAAHGHTLPSQHSPHGATGKQLRWSMDAAGGGCSPQHRRALLVGVRPKPRTSLDFEAAPATPRRSRPQSAAAVAASAAHRQRARRLVSMADHRASPGLEEPARRGSISCEQDSPGSSGEREAARPADNRWQPRMQRIASGQQLAELATNGSASSGGSGASTPTAAAAAAAASSSTAAGGGGGATHAEGPHAALQPSTSAVPPPLHSSPSRSVAATAVPAVAATATPLATLSAWVPDSNYLLSWTPFSPSSEPAIPSAAGLRSGAGVTSTAAVLAAAEAGCDLSEPASTAAAPQSPVSLWVASSAAWASSTVDALLWRAPSLPQLQPADSGPCGPATAASMPLPAISISLGSCDAAVPDGSGSHRRQSIDGVSSRHYTHGGVHAQPERRAALEQLAGAARAGLPQLGAGANTSALASVGLDGDCPEDIRAHVTDEHLLQFAAAAADEPASAAAAAQLGLAAPWAAEGCLLGLAEVPEAAGEAAWELVMDRQERGLRYQVWRQPLRKGLYMYRSRAVFAGIAAADLRPFHLDDHARDLWDENVLDIRRVQPASQAGGRLHKHTEWCLHAYRSRFPRPMAAREYQYARRVWHRPSDGGCYVLCRGLALPDAGDGYRALKVTDFGSGCVVRALPGGAGSEMLSLYFEDSLVRPGLAKMAVKGMWGYMQNYEAALRVFADARQAAGSAAAAARRCSLEGVAPRAAAAHCHSRGGALPAEDWEGGSCGSSSGDDAPTHSAYAAMARLKRGAHVRSRLAASSRGDAMRSGSRPSGQTRWAARLVLLAGVKVVHSALVGGR